MNEWVAYALRADTTQWMMSTFWYPRVLVNACGRLHEILIPFPFLESFIIAMCLCCLSFLIPISELIMSCLAMGMLLSILGWKFEQCLHCFIFSLALLSWELVQVDWLIHEDLQDRIQLLQWSLPAIFPTYPCLEDQTPRDHLTANLWVGWMLIIAVAEMSCWLARLTQMPLWRGHGIFTAKLSSVGQLTQDTTFHSYLALTLAS